MVIFSLRNTSKNTKLSQHGNFKWWTLPRGTVVMSYESEYLTLDLTMAAGTGDFCDLVAGDRVSGAAVLAVEGGVYAEGSVSGTRHCGGVAQHVAHMREAGLFTCSLLARSVPETNLVSRGCFLSYTTFGATYSDPGTRRARSRCRWLRVTPSL